MKKLLLTILTTTAFLETVHAQTATDLNEGTKLIQSNTAGAFTFSWFGRTGRTYFIQHSEDLILWTYVPVIESGANLPIQWGYTSTSDRFFLRLKASDIPTSDPLNADFDGDGVSNWAELLQGTDPLKATLDVNGLPFDWETYYGIAFATPSSWLTPRGDGLTYLQAWQQGLNPNDYYNGHIPSETSPPAAPSNFRATTQSDGRIKYEWNDNSDNERGFIIQRQDTNGNWYDAATVGPNQTSIILNP